MKAAICMQTKEMQAKYQTEGEAQGGRTYQRRRDIVAKPY